jgi:hypothetical protein
MPGRPTATPVAKLQAFELGTNMRAVHAVRESGTLALLQQPPSGNGGNSALVANAANVPPSKRRNAVGSTGKSIIESLLLGFRPGKISVLLKLQLRDRHGLLLLLLLLPGRVIGELLLVKLG